MNSVWQIQEAKNKFSEVIEHALHDGPQEITRRGQKTAIILSIKDYKKLKERRGTLVDFFHNSPLQNIVFERNKDFPREVEL